MFRFQSALQSEKPPAHLINVEHLRSEMTCIRLLAVLGVNSRSPTLHLKDFFIIILFYFYFFLHYLSLFFL